MSAPSESATSPSPCACTNISLMQLFHELKQKFPGVPDHVVSNTIELYCHDKQACETHLHSEVKASLTHAYHASSSAAARQLNELRLNPPSKCRNQPIIKHEITKSTPIKSVICQGPQTAVISTDINNSDKKLNTDANQNVLEPKTEEETRIQSISPITTINIDNCLSKYSIESPSDLELTNEKLKVENPFTETKDKLNIDNILADAKKKLNAANILAEANEKVNSLDFNDKSEVQNCIIDTREKLKKENIFPDSPPSLREVPEQVESTNYKIHKSNKIKCNLHEKLEKGKEKKTIKKEVPSKPHETESKDNTESELKADQPEKPKRPNTLDFIKPHPDIAFKQTLRQPEANSSRTVSPTPLKQETQSVKPSPTYRQERVFPLNVSVNVNCHMDLTRGYDDPWLEDYDSPRAITSVNLTVCTPTSNMASPVREVRDDDGFEGHVTVTVSPSTPRAPRRRAPPPPPVHPQMGSPRPSRAAPEPPGTNTDRSLIERQKQRLDCLVKALAQEKGHLAQLTRETQILAAPLPPASASQKLREYVEKLRDQCDTMSKRLEMAGNVREERDSGNFYSNIYTGQQPPASWQCHLCTFSNHPLMNKCEQCEMPRILGTSTTTPPKDSSPTNTQPAQPPDIMTWARPNTCLTQN